METVIDIENTMTASVYNIVVPSFNLVANSVVVSSHGEGTKNYPELLFTVGKFVHKWIGIAAARKLYRAFE